MERQNIILEGIHYKTRNAIRLGIRNGTIYSLTDIHDIYRPGGNGRESLPVIAPGLVELQINGFKGIDFNDPALTTEDVERASAELLQTGVTRFCPTLITGPRTRTLKLIRTVAAAAGEKARRTAGSGLAPQMIGGIHMEGPFISREDGPRGAHPKRYCLEPDIDLVKQWQEAAGGLIRLLTLAPELPGAVPLIRACGEMGIRAAVGHTACNSEQLKTAVDAGAVLSTHLGNGAHGSLPRHPNYIWDQLAEDRLHASMIADSFHLPDAVLKVFIRVKGEKAILVSDAMPYSALEPGLYESPATGRVRLTAEGKLHKEGKPGILAGSAGLLIDGVKRIARLENFAYGWDMASLHPAKLMNVRTNHGLHVGAPADLVLLDQASGNMNLIRVFKGGRAYDVS